MIPVSRREARLETTGSSAWTPKFFAMSKSPTRVATRRRAALHGIVTQADTVEDLHAQVRDAVARHFDTADKPRLIRLHFVRDEVLPA